MAQAASAFTNAFTLTSTIALGIALAAAAAVLAVSRRADREPAEDLAIEDYDVELVPAAAGEMRQ